VTATDAGDDAGHLRPSRLDAVLRELCGQCRLDCSDARLVKFTNSAVFDLPRAGVVAKIAGSRLVSDRIPKVMRAARWLEHHDFPAVRLVETVDQPVHAAGHAATLWHRVAADGPDPTGGDLGVLIRRFHALPPPDGLPTWDPLDAIRRRLAEADGIAEHEVDFLAGRCDELAARLVEVTPEREPGPIHGDAFVGNLIAQQPGPVLCDFDSTSVGLREWDLTPVAVGSLRFDYATDPQPAFAAAYGHDVTRWPGFPVLRAVRELELVTSVVPVLRSNPRVRPQFEHRLASLMAGDRTRWQPYERAFRAP
jgi:Phosphotransferase enzyme family